jgi:hypothetical protein
MRAILASRADDAPTSADAAATSIRSTPSPWHDGQTSRETEFQRVPSRTFSAGIPFRGGCRVT